MRGSVQAGLTLAGVAVVLCAVASPSAARAGDPLPLRAADERGSLIDERLSNEEHLTRYAHAVARTPIRSRPEGTAPRIAHLRYATEDGPREVYPALESRIGANDNAWIRVRIPGRPNGRSGWVRRHALGRFTVVRTKLRINRRTLRATLTRRGKRVWSSDIGVGARATPTPAGNFWIRTHLRVARTHTIYGPVAFGTGAYSVLSDWPGGGVIGIHGTDRPDLIPGRPSHGCVRVPNAAIRRLATLMPIGTPVEIV
jgi:lipoprotein-anchoring transpeptidase ErfK/SrfK